MSEPTDLAELEAAMAKAVAAEDFETAAALRDRIGLIQGKEAQPGRGSYLERQQPGKMGLGTDQVAYVPPEGWVPPQKPSPMTRGHSKGGRRTKG